MIVVTGNGKSGSWKIRGEQLGAAIGAERVPKLEAVNGASAVICVKRVPVSSLTAIRASGRPWVWDVVDAWPQPAGNAWDKDRAVTWLQDRIAELQPTAIVFPTKAMHADSGWHGPCIVLPHHAWPKYSALPARAKVARVGYEGAADYLGRWREAIARECERRGWLFSINGDLAQADIGIALRDATGYAPRHWKSNCKLANLQALGIPAVCSNEAAYRDYGAGCEAFVETERQLEAAFDQFDDYDQRARIHDRMIAAAPRLSYIAQAYREWLAQLNF